MPPPFGGSIRYVPLLETLGLHLCVSVRSGKLEEAAFEMLERPHRSFLDLLLRSERYRGQAG